VRLDKIEEYLVLGYVLSSPHVIKNRFCLPTFVWGLVALSGEKRKRLSSGLLRRVVWWM
jgi:hypothetical protein